MVKYKICTTQKLLRFESKLKLHIFTPRQSLNNSSSLLLLCRLMNQMKTEEKMVYFDLLKPTWIVTSLNQSQIKKRFRSLSEAWLLVPAGMFLNRDCSRRFGGKVYYQGKKWWAKGWPFLVCLVKSKCFSRIVSMVGTENVTM